ncbi:MAG: hypothetical protein L0332_29515 [Chloroflexi bacterium]|nr:hypothetical protein [Chloroflexota bacterium]MCI0575668.1 hypothetical protein [Chloroflexota bacterium]MCI0647529.1 hypothetical protein [Chloroflexota bacterium]MCI0730840.1 hypothetical protein [Chloroflexota bacterium]
MLRIIIILALLMHGIGHIIGFLAAWTPVPVGFSNHPWALSGGVTMTSPAGRAFGLLWLVAMIGTVAAGLGLLFHQDWWAPLAVAASVISLVVWLPWWQTVPRGSLVGAVAFDLLIILALLSPWADRVIRALD